MRALQVVKVGTTSTAALDLDMGGAGWRRADSVTEQKKASEAKTFFE
jgi:hypothetical protein